MVTFERKTTIVVKVDGMVSGHIKEVKGGWQYYPYKASKKFAGPVFSSEFACMKSLK